MTDIDFYVQTAAVFNPLREPLLRSAIKALRFPLGSRGFDAGCGIGHQAIKLAEAVGPKGQITGLDLSPELLVYAEEMVQKAGLADRISFRQGDVNKLPFDDDTFDWAWSVDCVGYAPFEPLPALKELMRVVKPGGTIAILAWSNEKLLPGYPLLEAQLNATSAGIAPFIKGKEPSLHFLRALGWFRELGLEEPTASTFVGNVHAPLRDDLRGALAALFQMRWPGIQSELTTEDWAEYRRLCLPESPDFILNLPDYYAFYTNSMFIGRVPS